MTMLRICIIGAGPRGTSVLERICANHSGTEVEVHVIDPFPPGPGSVWRTDQSGHLLMNTVASQVSLFTDDSVACEGPIAQGPSLYEWAYPELGPDEYPTRAMYGRYLEWVFARLVAQDLVKVVVHEATAIALADQPDGRQAVTLRNRSIVDHLDAVVLALGHGPVVLTEQEAGLRAFAEQRGLRYLPPSNPADVDLSRIEPGERVALRGMGLNFFDYLALFTEGRGGRFSQAETGLVYHPSGREPVLYAGSRRGIPHHARGENQKGPVGRHLPRFLTPEAIAQLRARGGIRFMRDIWPLVDKEVRSVYYETLLAGQVEFAQRHLRLLHADRDDSELLAEYGVAEHWDWQRLAKPYGDTRFTDAADFHRWLLGYLRDDAHQARLGNVDSPLKAALDVLRDLRNEIRLAVDHRGITGASYRDELARWYTPLNAFLSIGPPLRRIEEMTALLEAGVLRVVGPGIRVRPAPDGTAFLVDAETVPAPPVPVTTLIEARIPDIDLSRSANPLLQHLLATGQCSTYRIPDEGAGPFDSGGLAVTVRPYRMIDAAGRVHPRRFAFGVPTEYVHWVTAAGIRPGVGSVTLEDSDAIARAVLRCAVRDLASLAR